MKKILFSFLSFFVVLGIILFVFIKSNLTPVSTDSANKVFVIDDGEGIFDISQKLEDKQLIKNHYAFLVYAFLTQQNKKIQSGTYRLSQSLSVSEIIKKLTSGGIADYWLKIPEGSRVEELTSLFPTDLSFTGQDFLTKIKNKEGYIFPDSYLIPQYYNLDQTLEVIQKNFDQKFDQAQKNSTTDLTEKQSLVLASLLEREGKSLESKQMIAGIILNRLNIDMPLQLDATIQYVRDSQSKTTQYWQPISKSDISVSSSYNTYKNTGLPPKPICNPGYNSLYAAFHPTESDYLYYITGNDGKMYYAKTLDEHNSNIAKHL